MAAIHDGEFKPDAVPIALPSGLTLPLIASNLGTRFSPLNKWVKILADEVGPPDPFPSMDREQWQNLKRKKSTTLNSLERPH